VGKSMLARAIGKSIHASVGRVQCTADMLPGDITGGSILDQKTYEFTFRPGPVFANILLADEINRATPKTQSALLEAMAERTVTVDGITHLLPRPFLVLATQNPVELAGTFPLPEAQLDRFLVKVTMPLPDRDTEVRVLAAHANGFDPRDLAAAGVSAVASAGDLAAATAAVRSVHIDPAILSYIVELARATRFAPAVSLGVSPRGATALLATSRAWAWLSGRAFVTPDDVQALARPTFRHRISLRPEAELEGVTVEGVLESVLASVPVPR
jgi:MoxR-like ATPase